VVEYLFPSTGCSPGQAAQHWKALKLVQSLSNPKIFSKSIHKCELSACKDRHTYKWTNKANLRTSRVPVANREQLQLTPKFQNIRKKLPEVITYKVTDMGRAVTSANRRQYCNFPFGSFDRFCWQYQPCSRCHSLAFRPCKRDTSCNYCQ